MRPQPTILLEAIDKDDNKSEQILDAEFIYSVFYQKKPINLRLVNLSASNGAKYKKVSFSNPGHAFNLAERLNELFDTDEFIVVKFTNWEIVEEQS